MSRRPVRTVGQWTRPVVAGGGAAVLLLLAAVPGSAQAPEGPEDLPAPTSAQLADAVHRWDPAGAVHRWDPAGSVHLWDPSGHVSPMESERVEGDEKVVSLSADVLFPFGSAEVPPRAAERIAELVGTIPPGAEVAVEGHTDSIGSPESNLRLSQERAEAVAAVIADSRDDLLLEVTGFGETRPVAPNEAGGEDNPQGRSMNRRVEIRYEA